MILPSDINHSQHSVRSGLRLSLQPTPAWTVILGFIVFTILGILVGGGLLRLAFPVASLAVGFFLYQRYPTLYIGFTWWLYFLTPLVRRLVDYRSGFQAEAIILAAPFLVTAITLPTFVQYLLKSYPYRRCDLPFILAFIAICYSALIGLVNLGLNFRLIRTFAEWVGPLAFGFFICSKWRDYPVYRTATKRIFLWGALVMGTYGLIQFIAMPPWDAYWQQKVVEVVGFVNVVPTPFGTAVWSTTNTNGMFALLLLPGLLLLLDNRSPLSLPVAVICCLGFLLSGSRTSWLILLVALLIVIGSLRSRFQMKIILTVAFVALAVLVVANMEPFSEMIGSRLGTLFNVRLDRSFQGRSWQYQDFFERGIFNSIGTGMSSVNHPDSGIINLVTEMGWMGATPFLTGMVLLVWQMFQDSKGNYDVFMFVARAIAIILIISPSGNFFSAQPAFILWFFAGLTLASQKHYQHRLTGIRENSA